MPIPPRKLPAPFKRPSISVGGYAVRREWRWVYPNQISVGDIVPAVGKVSKVLEERHADAGASLMGYQIHGGENNVGYYKPDEKIWAFTKAEFQ